MSAFGFALTSLTGHHPGHSGGGEGGLTAPPDHQLQSYLASPKTDAPIFFLHYPLTVLNKEHFYGEGVQKTCTKD